MQALLLRSSCCPSHRPCFRERSAACSLLSRPALQQYLAIGEAPTITQQAFQQRSRWSKGHFQVFWSRECPLFDRRLNLFFKLAYSSTCIAYLSTGLSAVIITLVPILTILFGYFPIALNWWTVIAITAYYVGLNILSYACFSWNHYKARPLACFLIALL